MHPPMVTFTELGRFGPYAIAAGGLLVVALVLGLRKRGFVASTLSLALRAFAVGAIAFFWFEPRVPTEATRPGSVLAAVDLSRSSELAARSPAWRAVAEVAQRAGAGRLVGMGFGDQARILRSLDLPAGRDLRSDPVPALSTLLLRADVSDSAGRLLLLTDGALPDPPAEFPTAASLRPLVVPLSGGDAPELRARELFLKDAPRPGEPVHLILRGTATRDASARVVVAVDGKELRDVPVDVGAGEVEVPLSLPALEPGRHLVAARFVAEGDEPLDNGAATVFRIDGAPLVTVVSPSAKPLVASALRAQQLDVQVVSTDAFLRDPSPGAGGVVVLDRVPTDALSVPAVRVALQRRIERGGGLMFFPRETRGEMFDAEQRPFLELLPLKGQKPPPPPEPEKEERKPEPKRGLKPPNPEKKKKEKRLAPTLGLLLLVDASTSMKEGSRLRIAKQAAIAAAEILHPEDHIGVIAFNHRPLTVLELTKAARLDYIRNRVSRIQARGGTHFGNALEEAKDVFTGVSLGIKHVILLSDGDSRHSPLKQLVQGMVADGITVSTVGCGNDYNETILSDIAAWGRGKFAPAFDPSEVPQVFTIEAERVIDASGARRRGPLKPDKPDKHAQKLDEVDTTQPAPQPRPEEKPPEPPKALPVRLGLPAPYVAGVAPHDMQGLLGHHLATARPGAWVSLQLESGEPVAAHAFRGHGRVLAFTAPFEGPWAAHVVGWDHYQTLLAQAVRFLHPQGAFRRFHVEAQARGRSVAIRVFDLEQRLLPDDHALTVRDEAGRVVEVEVTRVAEDRWRLALPPDDPAVALRVTFAAEGSEGSAYAPVAPPPEIASRGLDLAGLRAWADRLGGRVAPGLPGDLDVPTRTTSGQRPWGRHLLPWLLLALVLDLIWKRLFPGERRGPLLPRSRRS